MTVTVNVSTGQPAPLKLQVKNTGSAPITGVQIGICGSGTATVILAGMNLTNGQTLTINMEPPIGAQIGNSGGAAPTNALPYATAFAPIQLESGINNVYVQLTYGSGTKGAQVTASARGRW